MKSPEVILQLTLGVDLAVVVHFRAGNDRTKKIQRNESVSKYYPIYFWLGAVPIFQQLVSR